MSLINIQKKIGVKPDGDFGPKTARAIQGYLDLSRIDTIHFLAQCSHESTGWTDFEENFNRYTISNLLTVFPKYFKTREEAEKFVGKPIDIGNKVYGGREGNIHLNDGYNFRGRGPLHLTHRPNYEAFARHIGRLDIISNPGLVATEFPLESAEYFFERNKLFGMVKDTSSESVKKITKIVNGGYNGLADREEWTRKIEKWITA